MQSLSLKSEGECDIKLATCQIVRNGILQVVHVGNPIATAHIRYTEEVEHVNADADVLEVAPEIVWTHAFRWRADQLILEADVNTLIGWYS